MPRLHFNVGVVVAKHYLNNPYVEFVFQAHSVLPLAPADTPLGANLGKAGRDDLFYGGAHEVSFYSGETAHYRDNFTSHDPSLWVSVTASGEVYKVTPDPYEGEALVTNNIDDNVAKLPMPELILTEMMAFFEAHHVEYEFIKRKRNKFKDNKFEGKDDA